MTLTISLVIWTSGALILTSALASTSSYVPDSETLTSLLSTFSAQLSSTAALTFAISMPTRFHNNSTMPCVISSLALSLVNLSANARAMSNLLRSKRYSVSADDTASELSGLIATPLSSPRTRPRIISMRSSSIAIFSMPNSEASRKSLPST